MQYRYLEEAVRPRKTAESYQPAALLSRGSQIGQRDQTVRVKAGSASSMTWLVYFNCQVLSPGGALASGLNNPSRRPAGCSV